MTRWVFPVRMGMLPVLCLLLSGMSWSATSISSWWRLDGHTAAAPPITPLLEIAGPLLRNYHQKDQLLGNRLCPADTRIQEFLDSYLHDVCPDGAPRLPSNSFVLDRPRLARVMSLPPGAQSFHSPWLDSYRMPQGMLHNPKSDRRTTQGLFHIVEGGLPVPADKTAVPKQVFARFLAARAASASAEISALPVHRRPGGAGAAYSSPCCCGRWFVRPPAAIP